MAKNMYQKREERKQNRLNNDEQGGCQKTVINWYPGHMAKTKRLIKENIDMIDVVYEVIDARMPYSSKIQEVEDLLQNKKRVLIMTKMDLCDKKETNKWIEYYEKLGYFIVPIDLEHNFNKKKILDVTTEVMKDRNDIRLQKGMNIRKTRVLIMGIPNVGKSTLINRLVGKKVVGTGNKPGVTKTLDWIRVSDDVELLDSPGILWPKLAQEDVALNLASLTAIKEEILPIEKVACYVLEMLNMYYKEILKNRYKIDNFDSNDTIELLEVVGKKRGCLMRGGEIDYDKVCNIVMNDMKNGLISGITFDRFDKYDEN